MFETPRHFVRKNIQPHDQKPDSLYPESRPLESRFVVVENENKKQELILKSSEGNEFSLNEYLPEDVVFKGAVGNEFSYAFADVGPPYRRIIEHQVRFDTNTIDTVGGRLALLHEIGHAIDYSSSPESKIAKFTHLTRSLISQIRHDIVHSPEYLSIQDPEEKEVFFVQKFREGWKVKAKEFAGERIPHFKYKDLITGFGHMVREERAAWANALRLYRRIKTEHSVDLFENAETSEVFDWVNGKALASYEGAFGSILDDYESKGTLRRTIEMYFS